MYTTLTALKQVHLEQSLKREVYIYGYTSIGGGTGGGGQRGQLALRVF
jgi:hypothetical protein